VNLVRLPKLFAEPAPKLVMAAAVAYDWSVRGWKMSKFESAHAGLDRIT
jgi:hypothetical protein